MKTLILIMLSGLSKLFVFSGCEKRKGFWPYAGIVFLCCFIILAIFTATSMSPMFEQGYVYEDDIAKSMNNLSIIMFCFILVIVLLLAAIVTRRLHDTGKSGIYGLLPLPFLVFGMIGFSHLLKTTFETEEMPFVLFGLIFANNVLYLGTLAYLVFLLAQPSKNTSKKL